MPKKKKGKKGMYAAISAFGITCLAVLGFGAFTVAQSYGYGNTITNSNVNIDQTGGSEATLGAISNEGYTSRTGIGDLNIDGTLTFGVDSRRNVDGYTMGFKVFDLNATTTASELNNTGDTIYVYDAYVRVQTATTTAISYLVGTSTASVIAADAQCGYTGACALATAADASILNTGTAAATTVGDTFFKLDYQGTDTRDGSDTRYVVPVLNGEYILAHASTSPSANLQAGGQAAQIVIKYFTLND